MDRVYLWLYQHCYTVESCGTLAATFPAIDLNPEVTQHLN